MPISLITLLPVFPQERWASMDLCAEKLAARWPDECRPTTREVSV